MLHGIHRSEIEINKGIVCTGYDICQAEDQKRKAGRVLRGGGNRLREMRFRFSPQAAGRRQGKECANGNHANIAFRKVFQPDSRVFAPRHKHTGDIVRRHGNVVGTKDHPAADDHRDCEKPIWDPEPAVFFKPPVKPRKLLDGQEDKVEHAPAEKGPVGPVPDPRQKPYDKQVPEQPALFHP